MIRIPKFVIQPPSKLTEGVGFQSEAGPESAKLSFEICSGH